jgi:hypothetical protein
MAMALPVQAGHSIGQGNCLGWAPDGLYTPITCRTNWVRDQLMYIRLIDEFSPNEDWYPQAEAARAAWTNAPGPQVLSWSYHSNQSNVYLWPASTGQHGLTSQAFGITWNCDLQSYCVSSASTPILIWYSYLYFNRDLFNDPLNGSVTTRKHTFAHEIGHALGLAHHGTGTTPLMSASSNSLVSPTSTDLGTLPACTGGGRTTWGTRCIYYWPY